MPIAEWKWATRDGLQIYARSWTPEESPKAVICLLHGHGEHINRYNHVGQAFATAGYALQAFDLRGHGQSGGPRGHTPAYDNLINDVADFLCDAQMRHPNLPLFLYGHSTGGNLAANYALRYPDALHGIILTSPWLRLAFEMNPAQLTIIKALNVVFPSLSQPSGLESAAISRDLQEVEKYTSDPLVHDRISARFFATVYAQGIWALEHAALLKIPMLLMHGSADRLTSAQASQQFATKAGNLVTLRIWDGFYHELHNEPDRADVIRVITDWVGAHV